MSFRVHPNILLSLMTELGSLFLNCTVCDRSEGLEIFEKNMLYYCSIHPFNSLGFNLLYFLFLFFSSIYSIHSVILISFLIILQYNLLHKRPLWNSFCCKSIQMHSSVTKRWQTSPPLMFILNKKLMKHTPPIF